MPALLTLQPLPALSGRTKRAYAAKAGGIQLNKRSIGRTEVTQVDLGLPFGISEKLWQKKVREAIGQMIVAGERYACLPPHLWALGREEGLLPCDVLPALRRLAAEAALDCMGTGAELGHARIYARLPSREIIDCIHRLAARCRYVSVAGGDWTRGVSRMLLREYGTAAPGRGCSGPTVTLAFDPGFTGEGPVIDLTREGLKGPDVLRPRLFAGAEVAHLPRQRFYDPGPLLGHLYIHGAIGREELRVWCKNGPKP